MPNLVNRLSSASCRSEIARGGRAVVLSFGGLTVKDGTEGLRGNLAKKGVSSGWSATRSRASCSRRGLRGRQPGARGQHRDRIRLDEATIHAPRSLPTPEVKKAGKLDPRRRPRGRLLAARRDPARERPDRNTLNGADPRLPRRAYARDRRDAQRGHCRPVRLLQAPPPI